MSKAKTFAAAAVALEIASEISAVAEGIEAFACSGADATAIYEESVYAIEALELLAKNGYIKLNELYDTHLTQANIGA